MIALIMNTKSVKTTIGICRPIAMSQNTLFRMSQNKKRVKTASV